MKTEIAWVAAGLIHHLCPERVLNKNSEMYPVIDDEPSVVSLRCTECGYEVELKPIEDPSKDTCKSI